jgi:hypothetical protein
MTDQPEDAAEEATIPYTVRFPIEWESRIETIQQRMEENRPAELLKVSAASIIRRAFRIGLKRLVEQYGGEDAR